LKGRILRTGSPTVRCLAAALVAARVKTDRDTCHWCDPDCGAAAFLAADTAAPPPTCLPNLCPLLPYAPPSTNKHTAVEDVKLALLSCLAAWLPKCSGPTPPAVVQQLAAGLAEPKEALRRGNLRAAVAAVRAQPGLAAAMGPLAAPLAKLVSEGCAKAVARADGVAALLLAAQLAAADSAAGEE
jgi:hypothetical protein